MDVGERADSAVVWPNERLHGGCEVLSGDRAVLEIADVVRELAERSTIVERCFDPRRAGQIGQELEQRGIRVSAFPQHDARMIPASQRLYDAIIERRIVHPDDEHLNRHVAATIARHGRRGWRVDKANRSDKIDAVVALAMALDRLTNRREPTRLVGSDVPLEVHHVNGEAMDNRIVNTIPLAAIATTRRRSPGSEGMRRNTPTTGPSSAADPRG
jgi:hypothetical protein